MGQLLYESDDFIPLEETYHDLKDHGIEDKDLHVFAKHQGKVLRHGLNAANFWYKTNLVNGAIRGFGYGIIAGLLMAMLFTYTNFFEDNYGITGFILTMLLGVGFGAWLGGFLGLQSKNFQLRKYYKYVDEGKYLLMIDARGKDVNALKASISGKHPQLKFLSADINTIVHFEKFQTTH